MNIITKDEAQLLITVRDLIRYGASSLERAEVFYGHGYDNGWDESVALVVYALALEYEWLPASLDARVTEAERQQVLALFQKRIDGPTPVAYLTNKAWFMGLPFFVDERVLVPRSPIGELIEHQFAPYISEAPSRILDLCAGSGCIGIACATVFDEASVDLGELSLDALEVALENVQLHQVSDRVQVVHTDLFAGLKGRTYDLIVSNPPYVNAHDLATMPDEYQAEPAMGLGSGEDGLFLTHQILEQACDYLSDQGVLVVEVGNSWVDLIEQCPNLPFSWVEFERGGHGVFVLTAAQLRMNRSLLKEQ